MPVMSNSLIALFCFRKSRFAFILVFLLGVSVCRPGSGASKSVSGFSGEELRKIAPLFDIHGMVALAETDPRGNPKAMTLAVRINAPREKAFKIFENPENFYYISTLFKENKVLQSHGSSKAYSWASRHKWFSFTGVNNIALYPPRRIDVEIVKSSVGSGVFKFLFFEDGKDRCILVLSGILEVLSSEWLIRYLVGVNPAMRLAMNIGIGTVIIKGAKTLAEQYSKGKPMKKHRTRGRRQGPLKPLDKKSLKAISPLLNRGAVILTKSVGGGRLDQATVVEKVAGSSSKFLVAAATPELYPKMIGAITDVGISKRTEQEVEFSWTLGFSIFGLTSKNRLVFVPDGVTIDGLDGDLAGAKWRWQVASSTEKNCIVAYHGWADIPHSAFILEQSMKREPYLEHGFLAGSNLVMLRAIRRAVEGK